MSIDVGNAPRKGTHRESFPALLFIVSFQFTRCFSPGVREMMKRNSASLRLGAAMLTSEGCRNRRTRLWASFRDKVDVAELVLADPIHLRYLANFSVDPFSLGADFGGLLVLRPSGETILYHDRRLPESARAAHVDQREEIQWYDGQ